MNDEDRPDGDLTAAPARDALDKTFDIAALGIEPVMSLTRRCPERVEVHLGDLHCFGRPCRLVLNERRWGCPTTDCQKKTWSEKIARVSPARC